MVKLTFLGTGTSQGVPVIGCKCPVCSSTDPRDKRLRSSALVEYDGLTILVDAGPDFRTQMLRAGCGHLDAILLTHNHKDHTGGIDDTRSLNYIERKPVNIWCESYVESSLRKEYSYAFAEPRYPGAPEWQVHQIDATRPFRVHSNACEPTLEWRPGQGYVRLPGAPATDVPSVEVVPIQGWHHKENGLSVLGYRFGDIAYITDFNRIDEQEFDKLRGLSAVTVNCVQRAGHFSHFSLAEALDFFDKVGARESYITHISHSLPAYRDFDAELPSGVHPAYDGLVLTCE